MPGSANAEKARSKETSSPLMDLQPNGNKVSVPRRERGSPSTPVPHRDVGETQVRDSLERPVQAPVMKPKSTKAVTQDVKGHRRAGRRRIPNYRIPDYSGIQSKIDCWNKDWKIGGESSEEDASDYAARPRNEQGGSTTQVAECNAEETPGSIPSVRTSSPINSTIEPQKQVSASVKSVEKHIHGLNHVSFLAPVGCLARWNAVVPGGIEFCIFLRPLTVALSPQLTVGGRTGKLEAKAVRSVKNIPEIPCRRRTSNNIAHTLLCWGAQPVYSQAQQVWRGFSMQCRYC
ncbi:uncharacterized protein LOC111868969 [Cryptotermes secundus]|uniref:uncharacterized protein LOC111868969 n=1 Tax=Cryptotermes secundus TaxID=105785 RepID=UPI001454E34E|nr:uncharacterized protein LOC111868969 [Cryptotermes secundus]